MNTALTAIARRSSRVILGVSEASSTAVSIGPMTAKKVVNAVSAVSSMAGRKRRLVMPGLSGHRAQLPSTSWIAG